MSKKFPKTRYAIALILAVLNDALDLLGFLDPPLEAALDLAIALVLMKVLPGFYIGEILTTLADMVTGLDVAPFWTLYVASRIKGEFKKAKAAKKPAKAEQTTKS